MAEIPHPPPSRDDAVHDSAVILMDTPHLQRMQTKHRLPGTYIGVRKIRPSSKIVHRARIAAAATVAAPMPPIAFVVKDSVTGQERRMTSSEKRQAKQERIRQHKELKEQAKALKQLKIQQATEAVEQSVVDQSKEDEADMDLQSASLLSKITAAAAQTEGKASDGDSASPALYYFKVNQASIEQELADLRGDRNAVPPVMLSAAQAHVARTCRLLGKTHSLEEISNSPIIDDVYAQKWATALRQSMMPAVQTRQAENMRGMVYDIAPQVWSRLRPAFENHHQSEKQDQTPEEVDDFDVLTCSIRPSLPLDKDWKILMEALYCETNLHIGCGAKFGCDLLLYDGPRSERHSFAGLRLLDSSSSSPTSCRVGEHSFPLPRAYDLAGYVRVLNAAGKLALLATVVHDDCTNSLTTCSPRVAILDLVLEKVDLQRKPKPLKTLERRMQTLAKTKS